MSRNLERSVARTNYAKFAKKWRSEKRLAGVYGQPGYRRPSFNEWYSMQSVEKKNVAPEHAYLEIGADDPWLQPMPTEGTEKYSEGSSMTMGEKYDSEQERGVMTINIAGSEDD